MSNKKAPSKWDMDYMKFCASEGFDPKRRIIEIYGDIDELITKQFMQSIDRLEDLSDNEPITIKLNSTGGNVYDGYAIYDRIKASPCHVTIQGWGNVMSMATFIMQAADERVLSPNTVYMIHYGSTYNAGNTADTVRWSEFSSKHDMPNFERVYLEQIHKKHPRFKQKNLQEMLKTDTILTAVQAIELGLADRII